MPLRPCNAVMEMSRNHFGTLALEALDFRGTKSPRLDLRARSRCDLATCHVDKAERGYANNKCKQTLRSKNELVSGDNSRRAASGVVVRRQKRDMWKQLKRKKSKNLYLHHIPILQRPFLPSRKFCKYPWRFLKQNNISWSVYSLRKQARTIMNTNNTCPWLIDWSENLYAKRLKFQGECWDSCVCSEAALTDAWIRWNNNYLLGSQLNYAKPGL